MPRISNLPALTTADNTDEIAIVDTSASVTKKITRGDLLKSPLPANSINTQAIEDGSITPAKLNTASFVWNNWTPTWTGLTIGAGGILSASYFQLGKIVFYQISFTYGTGSSVGTNPTFTLPSTAAAGYISGPNGTGYYEDANGTDYVGLSWLASTTTGSFRVSGAGGSYSDPNPLSASAPFTWAAGDKIMAEGYYREA